MRSVLCCSHSSEVQISVEEAAAQRCDSRQDGPPHHVVRHRPEAQKRRDHQVSVRLQICRYFITQRNRRRLSSPNPSVICASASLRLCTCSLSRSTAGKGPSGTEELGRSPAPRTRWKDPDRALSQSLLEQTSAS